MAIIKRGRRQAKCDRPGRRQTGLLVQDTEPDPTSNGVIGRRRPLETAQTEPTGRQTVQTDVRAVSSGMEPGDNGVMDAPLN